MTKRKREVKPLFEAEPKCAFCEKTEGRIQFVAIATPGRLDVHNAWLHPECEKEYLRRIDHDWRTQEGTASRNTVAQTRNLQRSK